MALLVRPLYDIDVSAVLRLKLRAEDQEEVRAASGLEPGAALAFAVAHSDGVRVIILDGAIVGVFGVAEAPHSGVPWLLSTDALFSAYAIRSLFSRLSMDARDQMLAKYNRLENFVAVKNRKSIRWLKWLGAEFHETTTLVDPNVKFIRFTFQKGGPPCARQSLSA